ncbi:MAG: hypothetical protein ACJ8GK_07110 [Luteimonas sp.]
MQRFATRLPFVLCTALSLATSIARAQDAPADWGIDPAILGASGSDLLRRAPDSAIDGVFQAVHAASQDDGEARALCGLFEPGADRSLQGLNAVATQLAPASRERFANAIAQALVGAMQSPPQPYDAAAAKQSLKAAGATAAILHDGFARGLDAAGTDAPSRDARCRSLRWLLDAMQTRPPSERAAMTRWLLDQGLAQLAP